MQEPDCPHDQGVDIEPWRVMYQCGEVIKAYPGGAFCKLCGWWQYETPQPEECVVGYKLPDAATVRMDTPDSYAALTIRSDGTATESFVQDGVKTGERVLPEIPDKWPQ